MYFTRVISKVKILFPCSVVMYIVTVIAMHALSWFFIQLETNNNHKILVSSGTAMHIYIFEFISYLPALQTKQTLRNQHNDRKLTGRSAVLPHHVIVSTRLNCHLCDIHQYQQNEKLM